MQKEMSNATRVDSKDNSTVLDGMRNGSLTAMSSFCQNGIENGVVIPGRGGGFTLPTIVPPDCIERACVFRSSTLFYDFYSQKADE